MPDPIEPGSLAAKALKFFQGNPEEVLDRSAAAAKLGIALAAVDRVLQPAVDQGLITIATSGEYGRVWRAGPRLKFWGTPQAEASPPPPSASKPKPAEARKRHVHLLDPATVKVRTDVPLPAIRVALRGSAYRDILDRMPVGGSVVLSEAHGKGLVSIAKKHGIAVAIRKLGGGQIGVWRVAQPNP